MNDPIIILTTGRSGSSMVSGVFAAHGVWVGEQQRHTYPTGDFENAAIKALIKEKMGWDFLAPVKDAPPVREEIEEIITAQGYKEGPWLFKGGAQYYRLWAEWEPTYIFVRRPIEGVLASYERCGWLASHTKAEIEGIVERNYAIMDEIEGVNVYVDDIMAGDFHSLEAAFFHCGMGFDVDVAKKTIIPEMWTA